MKIMGKLIVLVCVLGQMSAGAQALPERPHADRGTSAENSRAESGKKLLLAQDDSSDDLVKAFTKSANFVSCNTNCNTQNLTCMNRCAKTYANRDPRGVACQQACQSTYGQCTQDCHANFQ